MENIDEPVCDAIDNACRPLELLQETAKQIYGVYDQQQALLWLCEEVGELIQALRQNKPVSDVRSEYGDVLAWVICLSNILDIPIHQQAKEAMLKEVKRQLQNYGKLKYWNNNAP